MSADVPRTVTWRWEERLKHALLPGRLYIRYRAAKEMRRGEVEFRLLPFLVDRGRNAVDAGANKGWYSHYLSRLARQVYAFEPNPKIYAVLRRTAAANVNAFPIALSDRSGESVLRVPFGAKGHPNQGSTLSPRKEIGPFTAVTVAAHRLDDLGLGDIGFIKIDVEGFEHAVLAGGAATIARDRPTLLIEMQEAITGVPIVESLRQVLALGYAGLFVENGRLRPLDAFDPQRHHRLGTPGYVYNFIFLAK